MVKYDPECLACNVDDGRGVFYDDHVHETDVYPTVTDRQLDGLIQQMTPFETKAEWVTRDSGNREYYESGMQRDVTEGKTKWHLITSGPMLKRWAELLTRGAEKYSDDNWMKANSFDEYARFRESAFRHFMQWYYGHDDEDHAAATMFNLNGAEYVKERLT